MILYIKFSLLILSITGYFLYFTNKYHIKVSFIPTLLCAWCSGLLFAAGLLNLLPEAAWLLYLGGFMLLAVSLKHKYMFSGRDRILYASLLLVLVYFFCLMRNAHFTSYDNFSHWATVVKDMLIEDRMPNFEDTVIRFQSYPLGSSLFLYYVCRFLGASEDCMLWAQMFMLASFLFSLTAFRPKNMNSSGWYAALACLLYSTWALSVNTTIYELRVDTLLPLAGVAAFAVIYDYRKEPPKALCYSAAPLILLLQIKNSGIFFYAVCVLFLTVYTWEYIRCHKLRFSLTALLLPLSTMYLWKKHVAFAFPNGMETKHSMSAANYGQVFAKKTAEDLITIAHLILKRFTSSDSIEVKLMLTLTVLFLILAVLLRSYNQSKKLLCMMAACLGCLSAYTLSLYAMYIFSMPMGEASHLASYDRYVLSVLIFIYGISMILIICTLNNLSINIEYTGTKGIHLAKLSVILITASLALQVRLHVNTFIRQPDFTKTERYSLQQLLLRDGVQAGDSCLIYCKSTDYNSRYLFYLMRYELWTNDILVVREKDFDQYKQKISDYDYFMIWDKQSKAAGAAK